MPTAVHRTGRNVTQQPTGRLWRHLLHLLFFSYTSFRFQGPSSSYGCFPTLLSLCSRMAGFSLLPGLLHIVLLAAMQVGAGATNFPATVEVDLVFPRNDTYAPTALFPIVFAFQNAALAPSLDPGFDLTLWDSTFTTGQPLSLDLKNTNFSSDPTYVYTYVTTLNTTNSSTAASYSLSWAFSAGNCSETNGAQTIGGGFRDNTVVFTIQSGAQQPDLVAATTETGSASCANMSHFAFNLTGTLGVTQPAKYDGRDTCAVFSDVEPLVPGNPCAVQLSSATASSILVSLTASACKADQPVVSCESKSSAGRAWNTKSAGYMSMLAGLSAVIAAVHL